MRERERETETETETETDRQTERGLENFIVQGLVFGAFKTCQTTSPC